MRTHFVSLGYKQLEITLTACPISWSTHTYMYTHIPRGILISTCEIVIASSLWGKGLWESLVETLVHQFWQCEVLFLKLLLSIYWFVFHFYLPFFSVFCLWPILSSSFTLALWLVILTEMERAGSGELTRAVKTEEVREEERKSKGRKQEQEVYRWSNKRM